MNGGVLEVRRQAAPQERRGELPPFGGDEPAAAREVTAENPFNSSPRQERSSGRFQRRSPLTAESPTSREDAGGSKVNKHQQRYFPTSHAGPAQTFPIRRSVPPAVMFQCDIPNPARPQDSVRGTNTNAPARFCRGPTAVYSCHALRRPLPPVEC